LETIIGDHEEPIVVADEGTVRFIVLNRPDARNAMTRSMRVQFPQILAEADASPEIEAVVLTGAGGAFSAGVDLKDHVPGAPRPPLDPAEALRRLAKPVIAAIDGPCITGALEMALSCDFAIATPAARFADTHCKVGMFPRWGGGTLLTSVVGVRRARQLMLTGSLIDAPHALAWGLINEIVPAPELLQRATELAQSMAGLRRTHPTTVGLHMEMLDRLAMPDASRAIELAMLDRFDNDS
jgi:enoyl-CoA hydratase